jgi:CMP-N-acetylneuraminic acid synthetase
MVIRPVAALVPMRSGSERIKNKNSKLLSGKPLPFYILNSLSESEYISKIYIDTDSKEIAKMCVDEFPSVDVIFRPKNLATGDTPMNAVLSNSMNSISESTIFQTHATSPFLKPQTISQACRIFMEGIDSSTLFSVTCLKDRLWSKDFKPINHDPNTLLRTQDLANVYSENSAFYIFEKSKFLQTKNRMSQSPRPFELNFPEFWDLDEPWQWQVAEAILNS